MPDSSAKMQSLDFTKQVEHKSHLSPWAALSLPVLLSPLKPYSIKVLGRGGKAGKQQKPQMEFKQVSHLSPCSLKLSGGNKHITNLLQFPLATPSLFPSSHTTELEQWSESLPVKSQSTVHLGTQLPEHAMQTPSKFHAPIYTYFIISRIHKNQVILLRLHTLKTM